jgi:hypothetical protein
MCACARGNSLPQRQQGPAMCRGPALPPCNAGRLFGQQHGPAPRFAPPSEALPTPPLSSPYPDPPHAPARCAAGPSWTVPWPCAARLRCGGTWPARRVALASSAPGQGGGRVGVGAGLEQGRPRHGPSARPRGCGAWTRQPGGRPAAACSSGRGHLVGGAGSGRSARRADRGPCTPCARGARHGAPVVRNRHAWAGHLVSVLPAPAT